MIQRSPISCRLLRAALLPVLTAVAPLAALLLPAPAHAARIALVIGNAAYTDGPLKNPVNDARAMDQKLAQPGLQGAAHRKPQAHPDRARHHRLCQHRARR